MLLVRFTASDLRLIERAKSEGEVRGILQLVNDRIAQSKVLKELGKSPTMKKETYGWQKALEKAREVLGKDTVTTPPFPDYRWFQRINGVLRDYGFNDESVASLAKYAEEKLRKPVSFDFLICMHKRILAGEFDVAKRNLAASPDLTTHQLPEE